MSRPREAKTKVEWGGVFPLLFLGERDIGWCGALVTLSGMRENLGRHPIFQALVGTLVIVEEKIRL
jgi:hypothetical protein